VTLLRADKSASRTSPETINAPFLGNFSMA
jgi:hypothetical protein